MPISWYSLFSFPTLRSCLLDGAAMACRYGVADDHVKARNLGEFTLLSLHRCGIGERGALGFSVGATGGFRVG